MIKKNTPDTEVTQAVENVQFLKHDCSLRETDALKLCSPGKNISKPASKKAQ